MTVRDIQSALQERYVIETSGETGSKITDRVLLLAEAWQNRPLASHRAIWWLDAIHVKLKRGHKIVNAAVYLVMGIDLDGKKDVPGHRVGEGAEGSSFWLSVITGLKNRVVQDVFIACVDGLNGFEVALAAVFPGQKCSAVLAIVGGAGRRADISYIYHIYWMIVKR